MQYGDIRKYAALMKELDLTGLEINENLKTVRLERNINPVMQNTEAAVISRPAEYSPQPAEVIAEDTGTSIKSPMVGVFYAAPAENADPYVKVGDTVKKGDVLCIIEAMKLMNEVQAEKDGVITEICVNNAQTVEYGTELFRIREV